MNGFLGLISFLFVVNALASDKTVNLVVDYKTVHFAGKAVKALAINNQIPAPTLHFKEGDKVTIKVQNNLKEGTAVHWHGIILPWQMDGVAGITQKEIKPGSTYQYQFTLKQSGTYWYHAHAGLQEQQGMYGAFIIDPIKKPTYEYNKDFVIVLSDWINTKPDQVLANLKKEGDYYAPNFPMQASLTRFLNDYNKADKQERKNVLDDYKMMQQMRMSIYDINDVAYDAILLNGHSRSSPWTAQVDVGDVVRLRFIGAGGNSIFHVKLPHTDMQVVHVQGNDVEPYAISDFTIAPGETIDVLVKITHSHPHIIYIESMEKLNAVYGALITTDKPYVNYDTVTPFPCPQPVTREMMTYGMNHGGMSHGGMNHGGMSHGDINHETMNHTQMPAKADEKNHSGMKHPTISNKPVANGTQKHDAMKSHNTSGSQIAKTKYQHLKATHKTNDPKKPVYKTINMELDGWMDRYIWFINGVPEHLAHPIIFEPNKRYRIIFKNTSMMHHPMHIHGHWFIVRNEHGEFDPLLHTIDMPPGATIVADIDADVSGQWLFHCHLLYHMMSGMSRVFQYSTLIEITQDKMKPENIVENTQFYNRPMVRVDALHPIDVALINHPMAHPHGFYFANHLDIGDDPFHNVQRMTFKGLYGPDYHKLNLFINDAQMKDGTLENADLDIFYWHLLDQFWAIKGGINYFYRPSNSPYAQPGIGLEGMMPYFIETDLRAYFHDGSFKTDLEFTRDTQITNNFFINTGIRGILATKTVAEDDIGSGLNTMHYTIAPFYRVAPGLNLVVEYEHEAAYGVLKRHLRNEGESTIENTVTFGAEILF